MTAHPHVAISNQSAYTCRKYVKRESGRDWIPISTLHVCLCELFRRIENVSRPACGHFCAKIKMNTITYLRVPYYSYRGESAHRTVVTSVHEKML